MTTVAARPALGPDRVALLAELESTRAAFHRLAGSIPDSAWSRPVSRGAWSPRDILVHLTWSLEYLPQEVAKAREGQGMFNMPKGLADALSFYYMRWLARGVSKADVLRRYDAAMDATNAVLADVQDDDWPKGARFYGHGFYSIEDLFHTPSAHLAEHSAAITGV